MKKKLYFLLFHVLTQSGFASVFGRLYGLRPARVRAFKSFASQEVLSSSPRSVEASIAFHGSSVGELEMLKPLMDRARSLGQPILVTAFSDSAVDWLKKYQETRPPAGWGALLYAGLSPPESMWSQVLEHFRVRSIWFAKYDIWPALLAAASDQGCRCYVINAQSRSSLSVLGWTRNLFGIRVFPVTFFCNDKARLQELQDRLRSQGVTGVTVLPGLDPRRVQIRTRAQGVSPQAEKILERLVTLPRPRMVMGSAWAGDVRFLSEALKAVAEPAMTLILFPHSFEKKHLQDLKAATKNLPSSVRVEWVEQKGVLLECYSAADWIWVGGGFDRGVHSTLEPAWYQKPIAIGSKNAEAFDEIAELEQAGLLTVLRSQADAVAWWNALGSATQRAQAAKLHFPTENELHAHFDAHLAAHAPNEVT